MLHELRHEAPAYEVPGGLRAPAAARHRVTDVLAGALDPMAICEVELLVSELVTNAVLHARTPVVVGIHNRSGEVRIEVHDHSGLYPRLHAFSATSATGRGLRLLDSLAKRWGVEPDADGVGKTVWCEVGPPAEATWEAASADDWLSGLPDDL